MECMRVFWPVLNREKHWYLINSNLPHLSPAKFFQRSFFSSFPQEVTKVSASLLTSEDGEPLPSVGWFKKYLKVSDPNQEVSIVTSFGFYVGLLNGKTTAELSKDFDLFRALLNF